MPTRIDTDIVDDLLKLVCRAVMVSERPPTIGAYEAERLKVAAEEIRRLREALDFFRIVEGAGTLRVCGTPKDAAPERSEG